MGGFGMITQIISTAADITLNWIPLLGPMANFIIDLGISIANITLASTTFFLVAGLSWIFYRPVLGFTLLACSIGTFYFSSKVGSNSKRNIPKRENKRNIP